MRLKHPVQYRLDLEWLEIRSQRENARTNPREVRRGPACRRFVREDRLEQCRCKYKGGEEYCWSQENAPTKFLWRMNLCGRLHVEGFELTRPGV